MSSTLSSSELSSPHPESLRPNPLQGAVLFLLLILIYHHILAELVKQWWEDPNFSHGFLVPLFSAFIVWHERDSYRKILLKPSWFGLVIAAGALLELVLGVLGAEVFLSRTSLLFLLAGMIVYFLGWEMFRRAFFAWAVLFLMVPIPAIIYNEIALPLQFLASQLATALLQLLGVPVLREGNVIRLPSMSLEVVEACSGIRSLMSLATLAVIYGKLLEERWSNRIILVLAAIPIAVAANGLRVMGTGLLGQYWSPDKAEGFFHTFSGWMIFVLSLGLLYLIHRALHWRDRSRGEAAPL
jgi:exosortase